MVFTQAVFQTVMSVAGLATDTDGGEGIDICFTLNMRTLRCRCESRLAISRQCSAFCSFPSSSRPFTCVSTFMCSLCSMIEAEGVFAGFASKGEEIKLITVYVLAVSTDCFEVLVHRSEGLCVKRRGCGR